MVFVSLECHVSEYQKVISNKYLHSKFTKEKLSNNPKGVTEREAGRRVLLAEAWETVSDDHRYAYNETLTSLQSEPSPPYTPHVL